MVGLAQPESCLFQGGRHIKICHCRVLNGQVFPAGAVLANGSLDNHRIPSPHLLLHAAAGAHANHGFDAQLGQLLHRNGGGRSADAVGHHQHWPALHIAQEAGVFPVLAQAFGPLQVLSDGLNAAGISCQDGIFCPLQHGRIQLNVVLHAFTPLR